METSESGLRLVLAEGLLMLRDAMHRSLASVGHHVVAAVGTGAELVAAAVAHRPDAIVADWHLAGCDGSSPVRKVLGADRRQRLVVVADRADPMVLHRALREGASGFVTRNSPLTELLRVLRAVSEGDVALSTDVSSIRATGSSGSRELLSERETEVMRLVADGLDNERIATRLHISARTVKNHLASIYGKLDASDRTQALVRAVRLGIVEIP